MVPGLESIAVTTASGQQFHRVPPAIFAQVTSPQSYLEFGMPGTGGSATWEFWGRRFGYGAIAFSPTSQPSAAVGAAQQSMQTVREGFGRTMSYLTEVFGVSRQTLYTG